MSIVYNKILNADKKTSKLKKIIILLQNIQHKQ